MSGGAKEHDSSFIQNVFYTTCLFGFAFMCCINNTSQHQSRIQLVGEQTMNIFVESDPNYYKYVEELDIASLWRGQISDVAIESQMKQWGTNYNVTVVISHCDKPIGWIWEDFIPKDFKVDSTYVYTKCGNDVEGAPQDAQIIVLPNVGRCDHTYAYHMARLDSDHAANNNVVLFLKDNDYRNDDGREFFELMQITSLNGFACNERSASFYRDKSSAYHNYTDLATFKIGHYLRESRDEDSEETFISEYQNLGAWHEDLNLNLPKPLVQVCYGGIFAALKSQIRERRETWPVMEKSLTRGNNIEEGHFSERSWGALLAKPLSPQATDWLLSLKPEVHPCKGKSIWSMRCGPLLFHCEDCERFSVDYASYYSSEESEDDLSKDSQSPPTKFAIDPYKKMRSEAGPH